MVVYMVFMAIVILASAAFMISWGRDTRATLVLYREALASNALLQEQIRDALMWRQPHLCPLPRAEKCDSEGRYTMHRGFAWQCPTCGLRWSVRGYDTLNVGVHCLDWVTSYEFHTGHRPLFDPRTPRKSVPAPVAAAPAAPSTSTGKEAQ